MRILINIFGILLSKTCYTPYSFHHSVLAAAVEPGNEGRKRGAAPALVLHAPHH